MPPPTSVSLTTRKRTRSNNVTEHHNEHSSIISSHLPTTSTTSTTTATTTAAASHSPPRPNTALPTNGVPKRQRNNPPVAPPVVPRTSYPLRNRSLTPDPRHPSTRFPSLNAPTARSTANRQRYNLRPRRPQSQIRLPQVPTPHPLAAPRRVRRPILPAAQSLNLSATSNRLQSSSLISSSTAASTASPRLPPPPAPLPVPPLAPPLTAVIAPVSLPAAPPIQPRQYRLVYISDDDDESPLNIQTAAAIVNTRYSLMTDDEDDEINRSPETRPRPSRSISGAGLHTRSRSTAHASSALSTSSSSSSSSSSSLTTINTQDFINGVAHIRLNRAIEIVIDSIQSLEGAVNNFDQLVFGLIYGRFGTRAEFDSIEGMIRLSRILNLNLPARLTQDEIDSLPKIIFNNKSSSPSSILLAEKCPICLTEFDDQETINKLHCTHLFHLQCISTWLSENDSCPTCRRKVMGD